MTLTGMLSQVGFGVALGAADMDTEAHGERFEAREENRPAIVEPHRVPRHHLPLHLQVPGRPLAANHNIRLLRAPEAHSISTPTESQNEPFNPWSVAAMAGAVMLPLPGGRRKTQNREDTIAALFTDYEALARERLGRRSDIRLVTPWDPNVTASERATWLRHIMSETYWDKGSKVLIQPFSESVRDQETKCLLTWFMLVDGQPVSTSSLSVSNGNAVMCYAASIPANGKFLDGTSVHGREKIPGSAVQYGRMASVLRRSSEVIDGLWGFDSYLRLGVKFQAPNGRMIESGMRTQHINSGPLRFLFCQPLYHKDIERVEFRVVTRLFLEPNAINWGEPLYTPRVNPYNPTEPTQAEIAGLTYSLAEETVQISGEVPSSKKLKPTDSLVFQDIYTTMVKFEGAWTLQALRDRLTFYQMMLPPNVEIVVENKPENFELQRNLLKLRIIALGVKPGGDFTLGDGQKQKVPTLFHFSLVRPGYDPVDIELANEYKGTPMEDMAKRVHAVWRNRLRQP